ncbi:MAG: hypothetical protein OXU61_01740 [Gammaproteobacteria bacterium]|nr:hypothetical protein [Gammaproteobacteria bacterium]
MSCRAPARPKPCAPPCAPPRAPPRAASPHPAHRRRPTANAPATASRPARAASDC